MLGEEEMGSVPASMLRSKAIKAGIRELYPELEELDDGSLAMYEGVNLLSVLTTVATPKFVLQDLDNAEVVKHLKEKSACSQETRPKPMDSTVKQQRANLESAFPELNEAYQHVIHYLDVDVGNLPRSERVIAWFGSPDGKKAWAKASNRTKKQAAGNLPASGTGDELIVLLATYLKKKISCLDNHQALFLSAGRFVAWKGSWEFQADGIWTKRDGDDSSSSSSEE
ncbi:hypothetical protein LSTR_LSTR014521 [Laodelphax striatellus]|uniref:Uncharacterized protein n=1 Tax=Laodelphax striatellus TaxID=195883 RepID=A0A482XAG8_LAOST|nr:hypothetical protein LSTR_LSTR014521 [Laodelphax striatellus]